MGKRKRKRVPSNPQFRTKAPRALVDIVIPVYGRFDLLEKCIRSIPDNPLYNLIIIDNNSPEKEIADFFYLNLKREQRTVVVRNSENIGFGRACNLGAKQERSPLIFFLNSDVILDEGAIDYLVREMDDPTIGICGMKLVFPEYAEDLTQNDHVRPSGKIQHVGVHLSIQAFPTHTFLGWSEDNPKVKKARYVWGVTGAAMMVRRSAWIKVNGFDESYYLGTWEDLDLCMGIKEMGYNIIVSQEARGVHYTNASATKYGVTFPLMENQLKFMNKWSGKLVWEEFKVW